MSLHFDSVRHEYFWNGKRVPNVTRVLSPLTDYGAIPPDVLETAKQKGLAVHKMVELHAKGDLDEERLPAWMVPVLAQWKKFLSDTGFVVIASEYRTYHESYGYAGTLDLFGEFVTGPAYIDVKRSFLAGGAIGFQLAAYKEAHSKQENISKHAKRYALKLTENGPYRLEPFEDNGDFQNFLVCLSFHKLKEKHNERRNGK